MSEYIIQQGDTLYRLAQRLGGSCADWLRCNPGVNPAQLQVGQKIQLPALKGLPGKETYAEVSLTQGQSYSGEHQDDIEMEIEGVRFRVRRLGESKVPHEIQVIVPRTEIRKVQPQGEQGPCEVQIMLSNVNIIHSPRLMSDKPPAEKKSSGNTPLERAEELERDRRP